MMTPTAETQKAGRKFPGNRAPAGIRLAGRGDAGQNLPTNKKADNAETIQSLREERDKLRFEHLKLQQAIYEAAQIQRKLCSPREFVRDEFEIAGEIFPVRHLSGDFFKVIELGSQLGLIVGDVAGKGLSAGIWQAHMMDLIQRHARGSQRPAEALAGVNRELCQDPSEPPITALFFAVLDPKQNELVYCNAGLPPPLILRHNQSMERLDSGGTILGASKDANYDQGSVRLNPGDMLLAYSDGLTECRNSQDEEFEMQRLSTAAKAVRGGTANQVLFSTLAAVLDFAAATPPGDDLTLLVVRRRSALLTEQMPAGNNDSSRHRRRLNPVVQSR